MESRVKGKRRKMEINIDTSLLIKEIKQRPILWDMKIGNKNYDRLAKRKCWDQLTELFSPAQISQKDKQELNNQLQKRWKNVKDQFSRSIKRGNGKNYVHTPVLQFLLNQKGSKGFARLANKVLPKARKELYTPRKVSKAPKRKSKPLSNNRTKTRNSFVTPKSRIITSPKNLDLSEEQSTSSEFPDLSEEQSTSSEIPDVSEELSNPPPEKGTRTNNCLVAPTSMNTPSSSSNIQEEASEPPPEKGKRTGDGLVEAKLIEFLERNMMELQDVTKNSQDEDRLFLLSLLTSLKTIQPQFQLKAKIEILSVLDKYPKIYEESNIYSQPQILEVRHSVNN